MTTPSGLDRRCAVRDTFILCDGRVRLHGWRIEAPDRAKLESVLELAMSPQTRAFELRPDGTWVLHSNTDPEHPARQLQTAMLRRIVDRAE